MVGTFGGLRRPRGFFGGVACVALALVTARTAVALGEEIGTLWDLGWTGIHGAWTMDADARRRAGLGFNYDITEAVRENVPLGSTIVFYGQNSPGKDFRERIDRLASNVRAMHHPLEVYHCYAPDDFQYRFLKYFARDFYVVVLSLKTPPPEPDEGSLRPIVTRPEFVLAHRERATPR